MGQGLGRGRLGNKLDLSEHVFRFELGHLNIFLESNRSMIVRNQCARVLTSRTGSENLDLDYVVRVLEHVSNFELCARKSSSRLTSSREEQLRPPLEHVRTFFLWIARLVHCRTLSRTQTSNTSRKCSNSIIRQFCQKVRKLQFRICKFEICSKNSQNSSCELFTEQSRALRTSSKLRRTWTVRVRA